MRDLTPTRDVAPSRGRVLDQFSCTKAKNVDVTACIMNPHETDSSTKLSVKRSILEN
jgi:hypothetical protein